MSSSRPERRASRCAIGLCALVLALPAVVQAQSSWTARLAGPRAREALRHPDPTIRLHAVRAVGRAGEQHRSVAALLDALQAEEDLRVRIAIYDALARRGEESAVPRIAQRMPELGREDRAAALRTVAAIGGETAVRVLLEWLGAPDVGDDAVEGLSWVGAPAVPHLLRALRAPPTAERAARALGAIGDARGTVALVAAFEAAPPALRLAIVEALGRIGDERASTAVLAALDDPSAALAQAAWAAVPRVLSAEHVPLLEARRSAGPDATGVLEALVALDPEHAGPHVRAALGDAEWPAARRAALVQAVLTRPHRALVPALTSLLAEPVHRAAAAEALARVPGGAGLPALLDADDLSGGVDVALALALRRHADGAEGAAVERARQRLAADTSVRGAVLVALSGSPGSLGRLEQALDDADPITRAQAALGMALLGPPAGAMRARIAERLRVESDPGAYRALAMAASVLGAPGEGAHERSFGDVETGPEAMWLAAEASRGAPRRSRARLGRALREALRSTEPRVRAGAALALARANDRDAWRALGAVLEDEHHAVRLAAARALAALAVPESTLSVAARERVERHADVRRALRLALEASRARFGPPAALGGREVLYARVVAAEGTAGALLEVDVLLPDGRWLRPLVLPGGELLIPDLPAAEADVQVRL